MKKYSITILKYTNSKPFVYGIENSLVLNNINLSFGTSRESAKKMIDKETDIALIPVAALVEMPSYEIISDFCIGANGAVDSVFIFSNVPIHEVKRLQLSEESRTSNILAKILTKFYWKVDVEIVTENADAMVEIGDRTFGRTNSVDYSYDLSEYWTKFTGLPFAFAVWVSSSKIKPSFQTEFNEALKFGLKNRDLVISILPKRDDFDVNEYLTNKIDYNFDNAKKESLRKFLNYMKQII